MRRGELARLLFGFNLLKQDWDKGCCVLVEVIKLQLARPLPHPTAIVQE